MLWLVIKGPRPPALDATAPSSSAAYARDKNRTLKTVGCGTRHPNSPITILLLNV